jgi:DNA-binding response OmpR family regulator
VDGLPVVVLADDDDAVTGNLGPLLERAGFVVRVARDGLEALAAIESGEGGVDLCVLDVLMPGLDGHEVLRRMRQGQHWQPVVLLTEVGGSAERAMALEEGADDYLSKPFDPFELVARLRAMLRRARGGGEVKVDKVQAINITGSDTTSDLRKRL